jgi:hypothetical protein
MHVANAADDAFELLLALVAALVEEVVEEAALDDPPPHALNATEPTSTMASKGNETRHTDRTRSAGDDGLFRRTVPRILGTPFRSHVHLHPMSTFGLTRSTEPNVGFGVGDGRAMCNRMILDLNSESKL